MSEAWPGTQEPTHVEADVYARVPAELQPQGRESAWAMLQHRVPELPSFLEGPVMDDDGNLFVVDVPWGRILQVDTDQNVSVFAEYEGEPNGLTIGPDGHFYIADYKYGVMRLDPATRAVQEFLPRHGYDRFRGVNDLTFDLAGNLYFTDQGGSGLHDPSGAVYRLSHSGELTTICSNIPSPNGLVFDERKGELYVAVTRDNAIWRVQWAGDGTARVGRWIRLSGGVGPDGLALTSQGHLLVAHLGLGTIWGFDRRGLLAIGVHSPTGPATTNVHVDHREDQIYITESSSGSILTAKLSEHLPSDE